VIKILQGNAVTQTVSGGLTIHLQVSNFISIYTMITGWEYRPILYWRNGAV